MCNGSDNIISSERCERNQNERDDKNEIGTLNDSEKKQQSNTDPKAKRVSQSKQIHWQAYMEHLKQKNSTKKK